MGNDKPKTQKKRETSPPPSCLEELVSPVFAAIKESQKHPLPNPEPLPPSGGYIWDSPCVSPEIREAARPQHGDTGNEHLFRLQQALNERDRRLQETCPGLLRDSMQAALNNCANDNELDLIRQQEMSGHTREIAKKAVKMESSARASNAAKHDRMPKIEDGGKTIDDLIMQIAKAYPEEKPKDLWPHLKSALDEWAENCTEKTHNPKNPMYEYGTVTGERKTITYETFCKKLRKMKNGI